MEIIASCNFILSLRFSKAITFKNQKSQWKIGIYRKLFQKYIFNTTFLQLLFVIKTPYYWQVSIINNYIKYWHFGTFWAPNNSMCFCARESYQWQKPCWRDEQLCSAFAKKWTNSVWWMNRSQAIYHTCQRQFQCPMHISNHVMYYVFFRADTCTSQLWLST